MTTILFTRAHGRYVALQAEGHSGYAEAGSDIVCAAVTTAFGLVECAVNDVAKAGATVTCSEKDTKLCLTLPSDMTEKQREICDSIMSAAYLWLSENLKQYHAYVRISVSEQCESKRRK